MENKSANTLWKLREHFWDKDYYWLRQVIQNSIHVGIPLRIYNFQKAKHLDVLFAKYFPQEKFEDYLTTIVGDITNIDRIKGIARLRKDQDIWNELFKEFKSNTPWVTSISFPHPFWDSLVGVLEAPQRWWIDLYWYCQLVKNRHTQKEFATKPLFTENIGKHLKWGYIALDENHLIVSSLIWELSAEKRHDAFLENLIMEITSSLKEAFEIRQEVNFGDKLKLIEPILREIFPEYLKQTKDIFTVLLNTEIEFSPKYFRRYFCTALARVAVFVHRPTIRTFIKDILCHSKDREVKIWQFFKKHTSREKVRLIYKIDFSPPFAKGDDPRQKQKTKKELQKEDCLDMLSPPAYVELSLNDDNGLKMQLKGNYADEGISSTNFKGHYWVCQNGQTIQPDEALELEWSHFVAQMKIKARFFEQQVLQSIMEQLRNHWGNIALPKDEVAVKRILDDVIKEVTHLFTGDYGVLCVYKSKYKEGRSGQNLIDVLVPKGSYVNPFQYESDEHEGIKENLTDFLVHIETKDKNKSIIYRAFLEKEKQITRFHDTKTNLSLPIGQPILVPEKISKKGVISAMAVPLKIAGVPFGCVGVGGFHSFQFRWANLDHLSHLAEIISPFLFQERFLRVLEEMTSVVLSQMTDSDKYKKISEGLAEIFLCFGASIWRADEKEHGKFVCQEAYHCPGLESLMGKGINPSFTEMKQDPLAYTIREINSDVTWDLCELSKQPELRDKLKAPKAVKYAIILHFQGCDHKVEGVAILYSNDEYSKKEWQSIAKFTSKYLALLLDTMEGRRRWHRSLYSLAMHQIRHHVCALYDRAKNIKKVYEKTPYFFDNKTKSRLKLLGKGIEYSTNHALKVIQMFAIGAEEEIATSYEALLTKVEPELAIPYKISLEKLEEKPNLKEILEMTISTKWHLKQQKDILIKKDMIPKNVFLRIHHFNLELILENLLDNAIKFSSKHTEIVINWEEKEYVCCLSFRNQGKCLGEAEEFYIFEKDFQGSNAQPGSMNGTGGLGLFVVKHICSFYAIGTKNDHTNLPKAGCSHTFSLDIPKKRLVTREEGQNGC